MAESDIWLAADWPAPDWVHAGTSLRGGGVSPPPCQSLNLGTHVDDDPEAVVQNRLRLATRLGLPASPIWLRQEHGNRVIDLDENGDHDNMADGAMTTRSGTVCAVLTADCVPVLFFDAGRHRVAAVHIGWRGFSRDMVSAALRSLAAEGEQLLAWIGPHICARHYEVDEPVRTACLSGRPELAVAFTQSREGHWYADLGAMIEMSLANAGVRNIYHTQACTFEKNGEFFSHRRDGNTGRMASLVWMSA